MWVQAGVYHSKRLNFQPPGFRRLSLQSRSEMDVSKNRGKPPKYSILIGFSIIFTIHFGGKIPLFLVQHPQKKTGGLLG